MIFDEASIAQIHQRLQTIYLHGRVLLCGSYLAGEARPDSDLDFTLLVDNFFYFNYYRRHRKLFSTLKKEYPDVNLTIWPRFYVQRGWHYVYGRDISGRIFSSPIVKKLFIRTSLKLAYLDFLRGLAIGNSKSFLQVAKRLAIIDIVCRTDIVPAGLDFSQKFIRVHHHLMNDSIYSTVSRVFDFEGSIDSELQNELRLELDEKRRQLEPCLNFSPVNYLMYNLKFLARGSGEFLFKNPDRCIIDEIVDGLNDKKEPQILYQKINNRAFPIIVL